MDIPQKLEQISQLEFWKYEILGNTLKDFAMSIVVFIVALGVFWVLQNAILSRLKKIAEKTATDLDDTLIKIVQSLKPPFYYFLSFYIALKYLGISETALSIATAILIVWIISQIIVAVQILIDYIAQKKLKDDSDRGTETAVGAIKIFAKVVLWSGGILMILSNLGVDITALVAGLGIGGIAIALAAQNILADLFSSISIYFDKPFEVGDFIAIGDKKGTVEKIGIKTTRLKALQGEELVISNQELTSSQVQNYKKMKERRADFSFGVTYETPTEKLREIPVVVQAIIESMSGARFDRAHFVSFDDSALSFKVVYYVNSKDYSVYADIQQEINFKIKEQFEQKGIDMAYPTQTIYMAKSG